MACAIEDTKNEKQIKVQSFRIQRNRNVFEAKMQYFFPNHKKSTGIIHEFEHFLHQTITPSDMSMNPVDIKFHNIEKKNQNDWFGFTQSTVRLNFVSISYCDTFLTIVLYYDQIDNDLCILITFEVLSTSTQSGTGTEPPE